MSGETYELRIERERYREGTMAWLKKSLEDGSLAISEIFRKDCNNGNQLALVISYKGDSRDLAVYDASSVIGGDLPEIIPRLTREMEELLKGIAFQWLEMVRTELDHENATFEVKVCRPAPPKDTDERQVVLAIAPAN